MKLVLCIKIYKLSVKDSADIHTAIMKTSKKKKKAKNPKPYNWDVRHLLKSYFIRCFH